MSAGFRRNAAGIGSLLLFCSLGFGAWEQLNSGTTAELHSVHFPEGTQVGYTVGEVNESLGGYSVVVKTTDGGATWQTQNVGPYGMLNSVYFKDNNNGYAVGDFGAAIRTTDGGANWTSMTVGVAEDLTRIQFPEDGQVGYIFTHPASPPSVLFKTTDGGSSWSAISVGGPSGVTRGGGFANDTVGVVVGEDGLVLGTDGPQDAQTNADLVAVAFSPTDPNRAYLIGNDSTRGLIRYTHDGGATPWDSVRCWPTAAFYGIDMPTSTVAYVCGTGGVIMASIEPDDFYRTRTPDSTNTLFGLCFPVGLDTGYAVGAGGTILRTYDHGLFWIPWIAENSRRALSQSGIRIVSNPSRHGITFQAEADVHVAVFDATGRVVMSRAASEGLNFLPLSKAGAYFVKAGAQTVRVVLTE